MKAKTWRCFHCDEVFRSRKAAWAHFGPDQECEKLPPACIDPLRRDEKQRLTELREAQQYAFEMQEEANKQEDRADLAESELAHFKAITKCDSLHALRMKMDEIEGERITARKMTEAVLAKYPDVWREVAQGEPWGEQMVEAIKADTRLQQRQEPIPGVAPVGEPAHPPKGDT